MQGDKMKFTKMHGIGNDYIYFYGGIDNPSETSVKLSDRHKGVGADGIVLILKSDKADFFMRMFNADGSEGKMCGNAIRCVGKYVYERGYTDKTELEIETLSGIKRLFLNVENSVVTSVRVDMGKYDLDPKSLPADIPLERVVNYPFTIDGKEFGITCVSMGNPHCVVFYDGIDEMPLERLGPLFENHPVFPEKVNTEFIEVIDKNTIKMRVWERGSGETFACGTGACAAVTAAAVNGKVSFDTDVTVKLLGGELTIRCQSDGRVFMSGPAEFVFEGELLCKPY